jgi:hypothetical protein
MARRSQVQNVSHSSATPCATSSRSPRSGNAARNTESISRRAKSLAYRPSSSDEFRQYLRVHRHNRAGGVADVRWVSARVHQSSFLTQRCPSELCFLRRKCLAESMSAESSRRRPGGVASCSKTQSLHFTKQLMTFVSRKNAPILSKGKAAHSLLRASPLRKPASRISYSAAAARFAALPLRLRSKTCLRYCPV